MTATDAVEVWIDMFYDCGYKKSNGFAAAYASKEALVEKQIQELVDAYQALD